MARGSVATTKRIRKLERDLARKEKALAEAAVLLVLKKTIEQLLQGRGRRHGRAERELHLERNQSGASRQHTCRQREQACQTVGISARTIERWRDHPEGDDARHGPHRRPHNALSPAEVAQVIERADEFPVARNYRPKQLVPQLADEGVYLASESTLYRLQRRLWAAQTWAGP